MIITRTEVVERLQKLDNCKSAMNWLWKLLPFLRKLRWSHLCPKSVPLHWGWSVAVEIPCPDCKRGRLNLQLYKKDFGANSSLRAFGKEFYEQFSEVPHRVELKYDGNLSDRLERFFREKFELAPAFADSLPWNDVPTNIKSSIDASRKAFEKVREYGLDANLIEPKFCLRCGSALEHLKFGFMKKSFELRIHYTDTSEHVHVKNLVPRDLELMARFLQGKVRPVAPSLWLDMGFTEMTLNNDVGRLMELFGIVK